MTISLMALSIVVKIHPSLQHLFYADDGSLTIKLSVTRLTVVAPILGWKSVFRVSMTDDLGLDNIERRGLLNRKA